MLIAYFKSACILRQTYAGSGVYGCNARRIIFGRYLCNGVRTGKRRRYGQLCVFGLIACVLCQIDVVPFVDLRTACYIAYAFARDIDARALTLIRQSVVYSV